MLAGNIIDLVMFGFDVFFQPSIGSSLEAAHFADYIPDLIMNFSDVFL